MSANVADRLMARVFPAQARATLLSWAKKRSVAQRIVRMHHAQSLNLFSEGAQCQ